MRVLGKGKTALAIQEVYPKFELFDDEDFDIYDKNSDELTIVSPGIPPFNDLVKNSKNIISDYDLFLSDIYEKNNEDIFSIWISGTNGKTTTTSMLEHLLKDDNFISAGNIGYPLAKTKNSKKKLLLETSSYTLHYTSYAKPNIYILLAISDDHLSWHGTFEQYENSKLKAMDNMSENDIAIIPFKYKDYKTKAKVVTYNDSKQLANMYDIDINKLKYKEPFLIDAILALVVEKIVVNKISYEKINSFVQDAHKLEEFRDKKNRLWVDDSKGTNIDATIQALKTYKDKNIHLILGGDDKGANLKPLFEQLKLCNVIIYTIGTNCIKLDSLAKENNVKSFICNDINTAANKIKLILNNDNDIGILSPAASSYDQFNSYKHRGQVYKDIILN